jgi:hypothetical protein
MIDVNEFNYIIKDLNIVWADNGSFIVTHKTGDDELKMISFPSDFRLDHGGDGDVRFQGDYIIEYLLKIIGKSLKNEKFEYMTKTYNSILTCKRHKCFLKYKRDKENKNRG